jgi:putative hydrolases of HD superfamily
MAAMDRRTRARIIGFILEADKLKGIRRETLLTDRSRVESAAEHSWHVALAALVICEALPDNLNLLHILKMLLLHDLVEIDAGDMLCYQKDRQDVQKAKEHKAAERIFNLLPQGQAEAYRRLWLEFEAGQTKEACFANAIDRLQPLLQALHTEGKTWRRHRIRKAQVIERMQPIRTGLPSLWGYVLDMIEDATEKGYLLSETTLSESTRGSTCRKRKSDYGKR